MIEVEEIISIAEKVNKMNYGQIRLRIKTLEGVYDSVNPWTFRHQIEFQYLLMKIIAPK